MRDKKANLYKRIIEEVFAAGYRRGAEAVPFERDDLARVADRLGVRLPKNLGDLIYSFRFRAAFPESITSRAPKGKEWIIRLVGRGKYCFVATAFTQVTPRADLAVTKVPDATPGIIEKYALSDEQALLAKVRYSRLIDVFTGVTCYSLQSHLRTAIPEVGQVETDEIYVGLERRGVHYVIPVQAKGGRDKQSIVQIEQDMAVCREKFPSLICRPVAAQFMPADVIALFEFELQGNSIVIAAERHYRLVPPDQVSAEDLRAYGSRLASP